MRFPEFSGEWEKHILGDYIKLQGGYAFKSEKFKSVGIPIIRISNLPQESTQVDLSNCVYYDDGPYDNFIVKDGDLLIAMSGATTGKTAIFHSDKKAFLNQRVGCFRSASDIHYPFLYAIVQSSEFHSQLGMKLIAGAQPNISSSDIETIHVKIPSIKEQQKISSLFNLIEERIIVQNKVIEDLSSLEKEFINMVFAEMKEKCMPLSAVSQRIVTRNVSSVCNNVLTISAKDGLVSQLDYFNKSVASQNLNNYYLLHKGDFAYNKSYSSDYPWGAVKHLESYEQGVLSPLYFCFRIDSKKIDIEYLQLYFDSEMWHKYISEISVEGARNHGLLNMSVADFMQMPIPVPPHKKQIKIVDKLMHFRNKRIIEQRYAKELEKQKKYLLNGLFL